MIILIQCADRVGLVAAISAILAEAGMNIVAMREHVDQVDKRFFMRVVTEGNTDVGKLSADLKNALPHDVEITIDPVPEKKIIVLVTKEYHCLGDILLRNHFRTLGASVQCVIGNHDTLKEVSQRFNIPYHYITHESRDRKDYEKELLETIGQYKAAYLVLAKFMRILSPEFVANFPMRIINIHHSFLPAFAGAQPYQKAYDRGVKLIGATSHFVTDSLDEGPIIAQQIIPVTHSFMPQDMKKAGREIETAVLARALHLVFEDRVLVYRNKTIVFE